AAARRRCIPSTSRRSKTCLHRRPKQGESDDMKRILEAVGHSPLCPSCALWFKLPAPVALASVASVCAVHPSAQQDADKALQRSLEIRQAQSSNDGEVHVLQAQG